MRFRERIGKGYIMEKNALVLSGGGARGAYEIGVWQALRELDIPIHIVTGTSVGALNGALVVQDSFDEAVELWNVMETHMVFDINEDGSGFRLNTGTTGLQDIIAKYANEDALRNSPIEFGLVTIKLPEMKGHYLFKEQIEEGQLGDYILASASVYPALEAVEIEGNKFIDGGMADVMPVKMAVEKGADNIIAVYLGGLGRLRRKRLREAEQQVKSLKVIKCEWDLGDMLAFDIDNTKRIMRLGYLDAMKSYEKYDGVKYTFEKGVFNNHQMLGADAAADAFELDPTIIYDPDTLKGKLQLEIANSPIADVGIPPLEDIRDHFGSKALVTIIARDLNRKDGNSIFMRKPAFNWFEKEIKAANFLIKQGLL